MVTDLNKKPSSITSFKTTTRHLSPLIYRSLTKIYEMHCKQIPNNSRQQINSAVLNKDGFILQSVPDGDDWEAVKTVKVPVSSSRWGEQANLLW